MIEQLKTFPKNVVAFVCKGRVTKADYDSVLIPAVMAALVSQNKVRLYYETAGDFAGVDLGAVWEDLKVGIDYLSHWERIGVVTDVEWIRQTMRLFGFLMPGAMKAFPPSEADKARAWITASN